MYKRKAISALVSAVVMGTPASVFAVELEEIVVTATKRAGSVQDIPYNISAVSGAFMERSGVTDMAKLSRLIPGIAFIDKGPRSAGAFANSIAMRGMNIDGTGRFADRAGSTAPTVATYVGNTPMFTSLRLKDIERVEVLRGPQGTLYGSGAMGGIVRLIQNKPSLDETEVELSTRLSQAKDAGDLNKEVDLLVNLPVADNFALRANVGRVDNAGFIDTPNLYVLDANREPVLATPGDIAGSAPVITSREDVNDEEVSNARLAALWDVSESISVVLTHHLQRDEAGGRQGDTPLLGENKLGTLIDEPYERDVDITSLDIEADLGFATMTFAAARSSVEGTMTEDSTGFYGPGGWLSTPAALGFVATFTAPFDLWTEYYGNNPRMVVASERSWEEDNDTYELRFSSNGDGAIDWLVGLSYQQQDGIVNQRDIYLGRNTYWTEITANPVALNNVDGSFAGTSDLLFTGTTPNDLAFFFNNDYEFTDISLFGELTWHLSDAWQVTGGVRYFDQEYTSNQSGGLVIGGAVSDTTRSFEADDTLFKVNTSYDLTEDTLLFATWAEGFRRGGANALPAIVLENPIDPALFTYEPDTVESLEIGIKGALTGTLDYTVTLFKIDWDNPQLNTNLTAIALLGATAGGQAENTGIEMELKGQLTENLIFNAGFSYVDAEITQGFSAGNKGEKLPVPDTTASVALDYFQDLQNSWELVWHIGASYRSETPSNTQGTNAQNIRLFEKFDAFTIVDLSLTMNADQYSVSAFIDNASDERGTVGSNLSAKGAYNALGAYESITRPRTLGVGFTYRF